MPIEYQLTTQMTSCTIWRLTNPLTRVWLVSDLEVRYIAPYCSRDLVRREAHGVHVVRSQAQTTVWHDHVLADRSQAVVDVHHWQARVGAQKTLVVTGPQCVVEYLARVVCVPDTPYITS